MSAKRSLTELLDKKAPPLKFLLECSDNALGNFELAKLGEVANLRREMLAMFDRIVDVSTQAVLAAYLRTVDRNELRRQLLESHDTTIDVIMAEAKAEIRNSGRSQEEAEDYGLMPGPGLLRKLPPEEKRRRSLESTKRWQDLQLSRGKCRSCSRPQGRESVSLCEKLKREAQRRRNGTVYAHGKHLNTLKALREASEKRKKTFS